MSTSAAAVIATTATAADSWWTDERIAFFIARGYRAWALKAVRQAYLDGHLSVERFEQLVGRLLQAGSDHEGGEGQDG